MGNSTALIRDIKENITPAKVIDHKMIFEELLDQVEPIDFIIKAYPEVKDIVSRIDSSKRDEIEKIRSRYRVHKMEYIVISVEEIIGIAQRNKWGVCVHHLSVYIYNGEYWKKINEERMTDFLGQASQRLGVKSSTAKYHRFKKELFEQFMSASYLEAPYSDKVLINLKNGTYEIGREKQGLREFNQNDFLTYQLNFDYDPDAQCPKWFEFLNRVLPDQSQQMVLAEYLGYIFERNDSGLNLETFVILYGSGANGKSVIYDVVRAVIGKENMSSFSLEQLTQEKGTFRAEIGDVLLNYGSEISEKVNPTILKKMVSGEPIDAERKFKDPIELTRYAKMIFNSNVLPKINEQNEAIFRRLKIIHFKETIPREERNTELSKEIIDEELSGIFNWMLNGLNRLRANGEFTHSEAIESMMKEYRRDSDSVFSFIQDSSYIDSLSSMIGAKALHQQYLDYCNENGIRNTEGLKQFKRSMENLGFRQIERNKGRFWQIEVKRENDEECPF